MVVFLRRRSKLTNSSTKWQSPSQIWRVEKQNQSFLANWTDCARSSHYLLWLEGSLSAHLTLGSTAPFGRPPSNFSVHSLSTRSVQDTTPCGVLSSCGCSLTRTLLPQSAYGIVRVPRILDPALYHCLVLGKFLSVSDPTIILVVELLESFISAQYSIQCPSLWSTKKPSVSLLGTIHFDLQLKSESHSFTSSDIIRTKRVHCKKNVAWGTEKTFKRVQPLTNPCPRLFITEKTSPNTFSDAAESRPKNVFSTVFCIVP